MLFVWSHDVSSVNDIQVDGLNTDVEIEVGYSTIEDVM